MYFDKLKPSEKALIIKGLKRLVEEGDSAVFHNGDPGHPVYLAGASGKGSGGMGYAETPTETSPTFLMLRELTLDLKDSAQRENWWFDFSTWQSFCVLAVAKYKERRAPLA